MTFAELVALSTEIHTQIYEHWSMFISFHLALLGGLFAFDLDVRTSFKWGFLLFYLLFAGVKLIFRNLILINQTIRPNSDPFNIRMVLTYFNS